MQETQDGFVIIRFFVRRPVTIILGFYLALTLGCFARWTSENWFPITGDEPHYLIMAGGIAKYGTFEQTQAYTREFATQEIYPGILAPAGAALTPLNTHSIEGRHGFFNIHNVGLPLLLALPFLAGGVIAAKLFLVLASSVLVILGWRLTAYQELPTRHRAAAIIAAVCGLPFITAASQVYPDLLAGGFALIALWWVRERRIESRITSDIAIAAAVALLPWLQIKFSLVACVACAGLTVRAIQQSRRLTHSSIFIVALIVSLAGLAAYNLYAFGNAVGPYGSGALVVNAKALMVFLGLHVDQFQGLFVQNPAFLVALPFLVPYAKTHRLEAATALLMYFGIVLPSAMHSTWYGGLSFAGRFMWAGAVILLPATLFGLDRLSRSLAGKGIYLVGIFILCNLYLYLRYILRRFEFYNRPQDAFWPESVPSFYPAIKPYLPAFQDSTWAFHYFQNGIAVALMAGLILVGAISHRVDARKLGGIVAAYLILCAALFAAAPTLMPIKRPPLVFAATSLSSQNGLPDGTSLTTWGPNSGYLTFGPYIQLSRGNYRFTLEYSAKQTAAEPVGTWDVVAGNEVLKAGTFSSGDADAKITEAFTIDARTAEQSVQIRSFYPGNNAGVLTVRSLKLERLGFE